MTAGRPEKPIDWEKVNQLLEAGCMGTEVCTHFDLSADRFYDRVKQKYGINFTEYALEKRQKGEASLREAQYKKALKGDNMMLIWLGKNRLGQRDKEERTENAISTEILMKIADAINKSNKPVVQE